MDDRGKISFEFDRIEADLFGFKVPLPNFNADAGFVEVQVSRGDAHPYKPDYTPNVFLFCKRFG